MAVGVTLQVHGLGDEVHFKLSLITILKLDYVFACVQDPVFLQFLWM